MTVGGYVFFAIFAIIIFIVACVIAYESIEDDMTVGGYVLFAIFAIIILIVACIIAYESFDNNKPWLSAIAIIAAMVLIISVFFGMRWYFHSTESGKRAIKTQESNFEGGIKRSVIYFKTGTVIVEEVK